MGHHYMRQQWHAWSMTCMSVAGLLILLGLFTWKLQIQTYAGPHKFLLAWSALYTYATYTCWQFMLAPFVLVIGLALAVLVLIIAIPVLLYTSFWSAPLISSWLYHFGSCVPKITVGAYFVGLVVSILFFALEAGSWIV